MKNLFYLLALVILTVIELSWPHWLDFFHCQPDLLLIFMVAIVFYADFKTALAFGVAAGLAKDIFLPWNFAINTVSFGVWSYLIFRLSRQISTDEHYVRLAIVLVAAILNNAVIGIQSVASGNIISPSIFLRNLIIVSVYTTLLAPLIFKLTKKIAS
ncbi:MAG TPA: rod shape-determining protein MreD [Candidatus Omnitrophota bacterium]|nr:rod shape-determining protein MreD [Candidatus Omnitrophota bacterium]HPT39785.1 rod shape-determining protein MreD [Candidatus Omnitrophota bacterium]